MRASESVRVPAPPAVVFPFIARLDAYPGWLPLVHAAEPVAGQPKPSWLVELRTRVGPFARSKRLTMQRLEIEHDEFVVFERAETDGREHARWALRAELQLIGAVVLKTALCQRLGQGNLSCPGRAQSGLQGNHTAARNIILIDNHKTTCRFNGLSCIKSRGPSAF